MKTNFINQYSKSAKSFQINDIIDQKKEYASVPNFNKMIGTVAYNYDSKCGHMKAFDHNTKNSIISCFINKYKSIDESNIKTLPISTSHIIKQKVFGDVVYLSKCDTSYIYSLFRKSSFLSDKNLVSKLKKDFKYKFLIDKYCAKGGCIEIIVDENDVYLTNIYIPKKIINQNDISKIAEDYELLSSKIIGNNILEYDINLIDFIYNDYYFNDKDLVKNKEYIIMFEFKNSNYLFYKIII